MALVDRSGAPWAATTFAIAEESCKLRGGHLVSIGDPAEDAFVASLVSGTGGVAWIGLHDRDDAQGNDLEGHFRYVDGAMVSYAAWATGEKRPG